MYTFFYSNISEFVGDLEGMIDEGTYKTSIQNMHKLGCKADTSSTLMHQCCVMVVVFYNILRFMKKLKYISNVTTSICGNLFRWKGSPIFCKKVGLLH